MAEPSFSVLASETLERLLERLEAAETLEDVDMDLIDGVLTLECEDGSQIIVNRQEPLRQLWLASPLGPAHFRYEPDQAAWVDEKTGADLLATLEKALSSKLGSKVSL